MGKYIKDLVSVIIPTYKRSEKLLRAIDSVLNQTYDKIELLIVNDNEPNDSFTKELKLKVEKYNNDSRFHLIVQDKHINGAVARNVGIKKAKGEYIAFLDDDDWWDVTKLEKQVKCIEELSADWGVVSCKIKRYNNDKLIAMLPKYDDGFVYKDIMMLKADFATGTLLIRHDALDQSGYFDERLLRHQDLQLLVNLTFHYKLFQVNEYLHCCDISDGQNRPSIEKLITAKKEFFTSVYNIYKTLSESEKKQVKLLNSFELGYVQLRNKDFIGALKSLFPILLSWTAIKTICKKINRKYRSIEDAKRYAK